MKLFYLDLETTGVRYWKDGIHQISGCVEIDGDVKEHFDFKVQPNPSAQISEEALKVGGVTREQVMAYPPMKEIYSQIINLLSKYCDKYNKLDKMFIVGYNNASFDSPFFRAFFEQCGDKYFGSWFWSAPIDVMVLAAEKLKEERVLMQDFKLRTVAAHLQINVDETKLHDAKYDIEITRQVYKVCTAKPEPVAKPRKKKSTAKGE